METPIRDYGMKTEHHQSRKHLRIGEKPTVVDNLKIGHATGSRGESPSKAPGGDKNTASKK